MSESASVNEPSRHRRSNRLLVFLLLAMICAVVDLATRDLWLTSNPAAAAARQIRDLDASKRIAAIRDLERFGTEEPAIAIRALTSGLKDNDASVRATAAMALVIPVHGARRRGAADTEVKRAVVSLSECLRDPGSDVRAAGLRALWMIASPWDGSVPAIDAERVEAALIEAATDPEAVVRISALSGLGMIGPSVSEDPPALLTRALEDDSDKVRSAAAEALVRFPEGLPRMLPSLIRSFEIARPQFRPAYAAVLGGVRPRSFTVDAVPVLATALASSDDEIRWLAADSLAAFGDGAYHAIPALFLSMARPGRQGAALTDGRDPMLAAARAILTITQQQGLHPKPVPSFDSKALPAFAQVLRSAAPEARAAIAAALGRLQPIPALIPLLGEVVRDPDAAVRAAALRALHDIGDRMPFSPPETVTLALEDESPHVRYWAAGALGHAGRGIDLSVPALLRHAEHDANADVRSLCADELQAYIKPPAVTPAVVPILITALESPNRQVRAAACAMLGRFGAASAGAIPSILDVFKRSASPPAPGGLYEQGSRNNEQTQAATALSQLAPGTPHADQAAAALVKTLQTEPTGWPTAIIPLIDALARFGPLAHGAISRLRELEQGPDKAVSDSARKALASLKASK